jgi:hypothetical protein
MFLVRAHSTPKKIPATEIMAIEYPIATGHEGDGPNPSRVTAVRKCRPGA